MRCDDAELLEQRSVVLEMPVCHDTTVPDGIDVDRVETNLATTASVARELAGEMTVELQSGQDLMADYPCFRRGKRQVGYSFAENARSDDQTLPSLRTSFRRVQVREALCQRLRANVFSCTRADSSMRVCRNRCTRRADTFNSFRNG